MFAGAGVSMSAPTRLPSFNDLRAAVLTDLNLTQYVTNGPPQTPEQIIADGIAPNRSSQHSNAAARTPSSG